MDVTANQQNQPPESLARQVRNAVIWRSGSQILAQLVQWAATFLVIRILSPHDYGLYAMTGVVLVFLNMLNGYGLASGLVQRPTISHREVRQLFGMLIALNLTLALAQLAIAPVAASYYRQPQVATLLRVQSLLYIATPFIALPYALLSREMDFRRQAKVNMIASVVSASTALGGALAGLGVWTLVFAPMALFYTRAIGMTIAARALVWPSFDFRGAGGLARFGGVMAASQLFWFLQSQADVFIGGRHFTPHMLGIYTTSLFLTQIFVSKFVPPLNEVAFSAYARIQHDADATAAAFLKAVRVIMLVALPFYFGLAITAEPLVLTMLGDKWAEAIPVVRLLACAMPFMTLQVLFTPASDALGRPGIGVRNGATGAVILSAAFLIAVRWGPVGLGWAWICAYPLYLGFTCRRSLPVIGTSLARVAGAITPPLAAASVMAMAVLLVDARLPRLAPAPHLAVLVAVGGAVYGGALFAFARGTIEELVALVRR
ncbi:MULTISPECIES: lipopolysaccharide biosynthesis protein [unclassified Sphingomonas]|uniref:lipopolysaccharide biosynthesis protein n=1 Tax=unclassified Sphingomonas TaxID=196159 RepID=UPI00092BD4DB|nr:MULTISPECIES: lipopolysaccharide biosynthesis protein [unclassified Sphingomonas]MBN8849393.1 lipopolysaccharide biosynthesis protein [Sphingomonas sp.]OJV28841.1 MAG: lipopolysaccharide biosynthesis protein [Sphingomonas sp. 67-36]